MAKALFDDFQIGHLTLKNRIVRSTTWEGMCDDDGNGTSQLVDYYRHW